MDIGSLTHLHRDTIAAWRARQIADPIDRLRFLRSRRQIGRIGWSRRVSGAGGLAVAVLLLTVVLSLPVASTVRPAGEMLLPARAAILPAPVWKVHEQNGVEVYSNGLHIDSQFTVANERRRYLLLRRGEKGVHPLPGARTEPVGIVYHTTESRMEPFDPDYTLKLHRATGEMLNLVVRNRSYHFVIDRFGGVQRIVQESDAANHAGHSAWSGGEDIYLNLNHGFLGVAFETGTQTPDGYAAATAAQVHSARLLTDLLRSRYRIPAGNCVTHAQVSLNPANMRIGYHTDWARNFPFGELGLDDNYRLPPASVRDFGFGWDEGFLQRAGGKPWPGLDTAERLLGVAAAQSGGSPAQYRRHLQSEYRKFAAGLRAGVWKEPDHVSNPTP